MNNSSDLANEIMTILKSSDGETISRRLLNRELQESYNSEQIDKIISELLNDFVIDLVVDYPPEDSDIYEGKPVWHIKLLSDAEADEHRNLPPIKLALLRLLQQTDDSVFPGELPVDEVRKTLREQGFDEDSVERLLFIKERVRIFDTTINGKSERCYCIIPEYEKTDEYKQEQEQIQRESDEKEARKHYHSIIHDLASDIFNAVKEAPEGLSREDILKQLPDYPATYIDDAFSIALDYDDILQVDHPSGKQWYRLNPDYEEYE